MFACLLQYVLEQRGNFSILIVIQHFPKTRSFGYCDAKGGLTRVRWPGEDRPPA